MHATITVTGKTWDESRAGVVDAQHAVARYEQVPARIGDRIGTFVLATSGVHSDAVARTAVAIVDASGTGGLTGISGSGSYVAGAMEWTMELD